MAEVAYLDSVQFSGLVRRVRWTASGDGLYWVWRNGVLVGVTQKTFFDVQMRPGETVEVAVYDSVSDRPGECLPYYATLGWENPLVKGSPVAAVKYRIDEYVDSAWAERQQVEDTGLPFYSWPTGVLADCSAHRYRVTPIAASGAEGLALELSVFMVRRPDPPLATYSLGEGGVVTVN